MHVETRMGPKPFGDRRRFVGGVVVANQVDVEVDGDLVVKLDQELLELGGAVTAVDRSDDLAGGHIQRREQVVMPWRT